MKSINSQENNILYGDSMLASTKLYNKYQTVVPSEIRKRLNVEEDDILEWDVTEDGCAKIMFRKKMTDEDIIGIIDGKLPYNAAELKKMAQMGNDKFDF